MSGFFAWSSTRTASLIAPRDGVWEALGWLVVHGSFRDILRTHVGGNLYDGRAGTTIAQWWNACRSTLATISGFQMTSL